MREILQGSATLLRLCWREDARKTVVAAVLMLLSGAVMPLVAWALKVLTDAVVAGDMATAAWSGVAVAVLLLGSLTLAHFAHIAYFELSELNELTIGEELMDLANGSTGIEHHERPDYADRLATLSRETGDLQRALEALLASVGLAVGLTITAVLLTTLNPILLLMPILALPPLWAGRWAQNRLDRAKTDAAEDLRASEHLVDLATTSGPVKELRIFGLEDEVRSRHRRRWQAATAQLWRAHVTGTLARGVGQVVFAVGYLGAVLLIVAQAIRGRSTVGDVVLVIALAAQVNQQTAQAVALLHELQGMAKALARLRWLQAAVQRETAGEPAPPPDRLEDGIRLEGVRFSYPETDQVVLDVDELHIPAGSTLAIVGENGAGKTTLVKLLCRFYDPDAGRILLDGHDLSELDLAAWRERIASGFQDFARLELLARQTVGVGDLPQVDVEIAVTAALERAHAGDVIDILPDRLGTHLGKTYADGVELSGGQWQKLALGRAMMREQPLVLVLDEPTAALDAMAEHALFERYAEGAKRVAELTGAITVLVSHRFSTVRMADVIVVIDGGRILEHGSHDQLMAAGGLYAELYELQAASYR
jgi:ATP-binding cassette, subfamily B, bacterial